ncbi:MAG TPA: hypothetical protein V6D10_11390 [Trichocoleus sp.]|jgi:hypothetical protein
MSQFENTKIAARDITVRVFKEIHDEIRRDYLASSSDNLARISKSINRVVPSVVASKRSLLLDSILNCLAKEGVKNLEGAENRIINDFYSQNRDWERRLRDELQSFESSSENVIPIPDPRFLYSAVAFLVLLFVTAWFGKEVPNLGFPVLQFLVLIFATGASVLTYQNSIPLAMKQIEEHVMQYLRKAQTQTEQELQRIINRYEKYFIEFKQSKRTY